MKVLYVAYHDPVNIDVSSSSDYFFYRAVCESGFEAKYIGPFETSPDKLENLVARVYQRSGKRYLKYKMSASWKSSLVVNKVVRDWEPDIVLTINPLPLIFYSAKVPFIYSLDTTFYGREQFWPQYGRLALKLSMWQEQRIFRKASRLITHSKWSQNILQNIYKVPEEKINVFTIPSALPEHIVPDEIDITSIKAIKYPIKLLLVGRDYRRKGIDVSIELVHMLNRAGFPAILTICGTSGVNDEYVKFIGPYKKNDPDQLSKYVSLYEHAHFLIHPALFEAAGIVPAEAAAFGTPTITNDVGGLATTVSNNESGIVLPKWSPAEAYVKVIIDLMNNPQEYYHLCHQARERYIRELNWKVVGKKMMNIVREVATQG